MTTTTLDAGKNDVEKVTARITSHLGPPSEWWWPGGWPGDIEAALVDAVFSARAVYRSKNGKGIYANVAAWRAGRDRTDWSLDELIAEIDGMGVDAWAGHFGNRQHSPTRPPDAPGGPSKAAAVREAAGALREQGINTATDIGLGNTETAQRVLAAVPGIGRGTANYFLMLLGAPRSQAGPDGAPVSAGRGRASVLRRPSRERRYRCGRAARRPAVCPRPRDLALREQQGRRPAQPVRRPVSL